MNKNEVADLFEKIALLIALKKDSNVYEVRAYENAARALGNLAGDLEQLVAEQKHKGVAGLGTIMIKRIEEAVKTGHIALYDELVADTPQIKLDMLRIVGLGPKRINTICDELKVSSIADLEQACKDNRVANLAGFGKKTQDKILQGISFLQRHSDRYLLSIAEEEAARMCVVLASRPEIIRLQVAGSLRRCRETVKDIDIVVSVADDATSEVRRALMAFFTSQPSVKVITGQGETKSSVVLGSGMAMDLRVVGDSQFPFTLHHFTGSREHHIPLRRRAQSLNMTINDYGLFKIENGNETLIPCQDEAEIYAALGMDYIEPELREDMGEIEAAAQHQLPSLVQQSDLCGILHAHSTWSDGQNTIRDMAEACMAHGYSYLGITDHSKVASYANGLNEEALKRQGEEIDQLNAEFAGRFRILKGTECDILRDGTLDFSDDVLASLDFVIASIHSNFNLSRQEQTQRLLHAIENPHVDIIAHPTGRLLLSRPGYDIDMEALLKAVATHHTCIEINAHPSRLDLDWRWLRKARDKGIKIPINPDAHVVTGIDDVHYGVSIARKGWLRSVDVLNTLDAEAILSYFNVSKSRR
jgi:DNA polymerase (family 10)